MYSAAATAPPYRPSAAGAYLGSVVTAAWLVLGLFLDGWAHLNRPGLETFFTPWHALLYSGAAAMFGWQLLRRSARPASSDRRWQLAGAGLFGVAGAGDMAWHHAFGVETGLSALLSPTHLLLLFGGLIGVTAPYRALSRAAAAQRPPRRLKPRLPAALPAIASLTLATALVAFFLLYLNPFGQPLAAQALDAIPHGVAGHEEAEAVPVAGLGGYLVTTVLLVLPLLLLARRQLAPPGTATILLTTVAGLSAGIGQFVQPGAVPAALLAGLGVDAVLARTRYMQVRPRLVLLAVAVPLLLWPLQLGALALVGQLRWPVELSTGSVVLTGFAAGALALLAAPDPALTEPAAADAPPRGPTLERRPEPAVSP
jgi:hypothetical protein